MLRINSAEARIASGQDSGFQAQRVSCCHPYGAPTGDVRYLNSHIVEALGANVFTLSPRTYPGRTLRISIPTCKAGKFDFQLSFD